MRPAQSLAFGLLCLVSIPSFSRAEIQSAAHVLPGTTVAYFEISDPNKLIDVVLTHPLRTKVEALEDVKKQMSSPQYAQFQLILKYVESQLGMDWRTAVATLTQGGVYLGFDAKTEGAVLILSASDEAKLTKIRETFLKLARDDAKRKGNEDRIKEKDYRGITAYQIDQGISAQIGKWYFVTNKNELAKAIADACLDGNAACLANDEHFKAAYAAKSPASGWGYFNYAALRDAGVGKELYEDKNNNPAGEFLVGGLLSNLAKTPYVTFQFDVDKSQVKLGAQVPHDASWIPPRREYFFGADGKGAVDAPLAPKQTVLSIEMFRDIGRFWLAKEDLFVENVVAQMTQADSQFSTIFSGLDFGREVLGAVKPQSQFVLARQDYDKHDGPAPDIKLPAGALIFQLNEVEKIQKRFKVAFQSLIGLTNFGLAQQGQPQFELNTVNAGDAQIISASYLTDDDSEKGLINYNFSPSVAFIKDFFIISSTKELANELAALAGAKNEKPTSDKHTAAEFKLDVLEQILQDNRKHLVAGNVLQKGHSKEAAEKEIGVLLDLLKAGNGLSFRLLNKANSLAVELQLSFSE